jgi:serine-type D-Ala-D-Ala carboxypeptidase (penicillin-binding protein 5/6)
MLNSQTGLIVSSKRDFELREIASLTKIMTAFCVLDLIENRRLCKLEDIAKVSKSASKTGGTSAGLMEGDEITVGNLLYGLMLPSGNDAAVVLAEFCGKKLGLGQAATNFINEMNNLAKKIGLFSTTFGNPHGLEFRRNLSTARDVCRLAAEAMKNKIFAEIVRTKQHSVYIQGGDGVLRAKVWYNTNKLLGKGFSGIKTGVTNKAGPCLCCSFGNFTVTLLNCRTMEDRWKEAEFLVMR